MQVGGVNGIARTYIKFDTLNIPCKPGDKIVGVYLGMTNLYTSNSSGSGVVEIRECTNWVDQPTWNTQPAYSNEILDYVEYNKTAANADASSQTNDGTTNYYKQIYLDFTDLYDEWREDEVYGVVLKMPDGAEDDDSVQFGSINCMSYGDGSIYPRLVYVTKNHIGLESYWSTHSQTVGESGVGYVNDYTRELTFEYNDFTIGGEYAGMGISHYYNGTYCGQQYTGVLGSHGLLDSTVPLPVYSANYGNGWHLSAQQSVVCMTTAVQRYDTSNQTTTVVFYSQYVYVDADGTYHWFKATSNNDFAQEGEFFDEDGLGLTLTVDNSAVTIYVIRDQDNNELLFNNNGVLVQMLDRNGNATTYYYDDSDKLIAVTDASGRSITFTYSGVNLASFTDTAGRTTSYQYSNTYNSTSYSSTGNYLRKIIRPDGCYTEFSYIADGSLSRVYDSASDSSINYSVYGGEAHGFCEQSGSVYGREIDIAEMAYSTVYIDSGSDGTFDTDDDIKTYYCFDRFGRTTSSYTEAEGSLYTSAQEYTGGIADTINAPDDVRKVNRIKTGAMTGGNSFNLLENSSFENDTLQPWSGNLGSNAAGGLYSGTDNACFGTKSLKLGSSGTSAATGKYTQTSMTLPAGTYTLSAYVKTVGFSSDTGGAYIKLGSKQSAHISKDSGWKRLTVTLNLSSAASVTVALGVSSAVGDAYFDGVQLEKGSYGDYNLMENGSFTFSGSNSADGWVGVPFTVLSSYDGRDNVVRIDGDPSDMKSMVYIESNVQPSSKNAYVVSGWAKANASNGFNNSAVFAIWVCMSYTDGGLKTAQFNFNPVYSGWQNITGIIVPDKDKTVSSVVVYLMYDYNINSCYFDDICLTQGEASCYTYDENGNVTQVVANSRNTTTMSYTGNNLTAVTDEDGTSTYTYDSNNNITGATYVGGLNTSYTYNTNGTVSAVQASDGSKTMNTSYTYSNSGNYVTEVVDSIGGTHTSSYNESTGLLTSSQAPYSAAVNYTYQSNNNLLTQISSYGRSVQYGYNSNKLLSTITHNRFNYNLSYDYGYLSGVSIGSRTLSTKDYSFLTGELYHSSYGNGWDTDYGHDKFGRLVSTGTYAPDDGTNDRPLYSSTSYNYNKLGQLSEFYDSLTGITRTYDYDMAGRLTDSRSSDGSLDVSYTYDNQGRLKYKYNNGFNGVNQYYGFYYNSDGYLEAMDYDNLLLTATVDKFGRTTETRLINPSINDIISTNTYTYVSGNGANTTTTLVDTETIGNYGSVAYDYMPNGNIYWEYVTRNGTEYEIAYTYDDLGQLTEEDNFFTDQTVYYTYDSGGNITSRTTYDGVWWTRDDDSERTDTYTYGDAEWKDLLTSYNGQAITYDEIGNPTVYRRGESMEWSDGRRLTAVFFDDRGDLIYFSYDNSGLRTDKRGPRVYDSNSAHTQDLFYVDYYYDDNGTLVYERRSQSGDNASTDFTIEYFYGLNGIAGFTVMNGTSSTTYYYVKNILGDVLGITDSNGTLVAEYRYDAYGKPVKILDGNGNDVSTNYAHIANINPIRYRGYYYDIETGFYYLNSRYYDPEIGRFINADSILDNRDVNTLNMFAYCGNNPVNNEDPNGHIFGTICGGIIGGIIGGIGGAISAAVKGKSILAGAVTGATTGAFIGAACGFIADTFGTGAIALAAGAVVCGTAAAAGNTVNQYWNYKIEKKSQSNNSNRQSSSTTDNNKTPRSSNGKLASECDSFADYVDVKSIAVSGITAAVFAPIGIGANCVVNSAFVGLETDGINMTAQVLANFAMGGNVSILQGIIDLF